MIITAPLRRMILQRSQRGLTDVRIFISFPETLAGRGNPRTTQQPPEGGNLVTLSHHRL
jgi:hypothetical protein